MLFNSFAFFVFFAAVYSLYFCLNHKWQNRMLLAASYVFYGWWDWRFIPLLLASTFLGYYCGSKIYYSADYKKKAFFLIVSICVSLAILGLFKYFNFFAYNLERLLTAFGVANIAFLHLQLILPLGLSFYTFKMMSYPIGIYLEEVTPAKKFSDFALFVAFFPELIAGPIDKAQQLLPQIERPRKVSALRMREGFWLVFWGLFMKVCIADNLAKISDGVFSQASLSNGAEALIGTYAFSFQIYCDFCGYSNIAQGLGKWLGFDFATNFRTPLFATNPQEFWRRWHISLSLWFRDYLFNPLCLIWRKNSQVKIYISIFVTMTLIGLWHGAAWHYIAMGCYWGILIIVQEILRKSKLIKSMTRAYSNNFIHILKKAAGIILFFQLANLGFLLFRAETMNQVYSILTAILTRFQLSSYVINMCLEMLWLIAPVLFIGVLEYKNNDVNFILKWPYWPRLCVYAILSGLAILDIWSIGFQMGKNFIYLQF